MAKQWYEEYEQLRTPDKEQISKIVQNLKGTDRTAAEYAEAVGLTAAMMSRIINGKYAKPITADVLAKLAGDDRDSLEKLLRANGMVGPAEKERRERRIGGRERMIQSMDRQRNMVSILSNELFERGVVMRKLAGVSFYPEEESASRYFGRMIRSDFAVEMMDTTDSYEWSFIILPMMTDPEERKMDFPFYMNRIMERSSFVFLQDAWKPEYLKDKKISFVFCDRQYYERFLEILQEAKIHNRMTAVLIDVDVAKVVEERALICSDFQDMSSPFCRPVIEDDTERDRRDFYFFFDEDNKEDNE